MLKKILFQMVIGILLLANILFWCGKKEGFHGDELYSYQFISVVDYPSINADREGRSYLNTWHTAKYYSDYLELSKEEAFDLAGVWESIKKDVHPPLFYLFLEWICSLLFIDSFTKWSGLFLNIIFFVLTIGMLYLLAKKVTNSSGGGTLVCLLYGFSIGAVNTIVFIRMYMMLAFATVCVCYIHVRLWEHLVEKEADYYTRVKCYIALLAIMLFGTLTQYYFWIFAFFCVLFSVCVFLLYKKWRLAIEYVVVVGTSVIASLVIWPDFFADLFGGYRGDEAINNFINSNLWENTKRFVNIVDEELFSNTWNLLLNVGWVKAVLFVLILFTGIYIIKNWHKMITVVKLNAEVLAVGHIILTVCAYFFTIVKVAPYQTDRYIFNLFPLIALVYVFIILKIICKMKRQMLIKSIVAVVLIFMVFLGYREAQINYLYTGTDRNIDIINQYENIPAIVITHNNRRYVSCETSLYFKEICATYPTDIQGINALSNACTSDYKNEQYLLFVDKSLSDVESVTDQVMDCLKTKSQEYLFTTGTCDVYIINCSFR